MEWKSPRSSLGREDSAASGGRRLANLCRCVRALGLWHNALPPNRTLRGEHPVVAVLANTYYTLDYCSMRNGKGLRCCTTLLFLWLTTHLFHSNKTTRCPIEDHYWSCVKLLTKAEWTTCLDEAIVRSIWWYPQWNERNDMIIYCGGFPNVVRQHKKAIGWKLFDLPGINPSICIHRILMEEESKPIRQQQRRINPTILDVVKKEVTKLFPARIIYPISDSQWVSLVQIVPKKSWMTFTKNQHDERLNQATRKDHFPLSFIDQVLEKLAGKSHYYFLDGFSGYMQIHIALEDQHKTTFTFPFGTFVYILMPFGLCNAPSTFQHCMTKIFSDLL
ncbi:hypothetical protein CR513_10592, partial [Mucuna pruriens]